MHNLARNRPKAATTQSQQHHRIIGGHESHAPGHSIPPTANKSSRTPPALSRLRHSSSRFYSPELTPIQHLPIDHDTNTNAGVHTTTSTGGGTRRLGGRTKRSRTSPHIVARVRTVASR